MQFRTSLSRTTLVAAIGGALALGLALPAAAAPSTSGVVVQQAQAHAVRTKVIAQPKAKTVVSGKKATFAVKAKGSKLHYQWYVRKPGSKHYAKVPSATKRTYTLTTRRYLDGARYRVAVAGAHGKVTSKSAPLTVVVKPKVTSSTATVEGRAGDVVSIKVKAVGHQLTYRWQISSDGERWTSLAGSSSVLHLRVHSSMNMSYVRAVVSNKAGSTVAPPTDLTVDSTLAEPFGRQTIAFVGDWAVGFDHTDLSATPEVLAASATNVAPAAGYTYVTGALVECDVLEDSAAPTVRFRGTDGTFYDAGTAVLPAPHVDGMEDAADFGCMVSTVGALAPTSVVSGATWVVTGVAGMGPATQFYAAK